MQYNYIGSVAERFMKFRTLVLNSDSVDENLYNAIVIYIPKSKAGLLFDIEAYDAAQVDGEKFVLISVNADNYSRVLAPAGALLGQWKPIFNDGANVAVTLYCVVFDDTGFEATVGSNGLSWQPLTTAFNETYFAGYFKSLFDDDYKGGTVEVADNVETITPSNYADMLLCLSTLCENETTLSTLLAEVHGDIATKTNALAPAYEDNKAYTAGALVIKDDKVYVRKTAGTDTDWTAANWSEAGVSDGRSITTKKSSTVYANNTAYIAGDYVTYEGKVYMRVASGTDTAWTAVNWSAVNANVVYITDHNAVKITSVAMQTEKDLIPTLAGTTKVDRTKYLWRALSLIGGANTYLAFHTDEIVIPKILAKWFEETNDSDEYVGNKLSKIRLTTIHPTGNPSVINSTAYTNMPSYLYTNLDDKKVGYFISIDDSSVNNSELISERKLNDRPISADIITSFIDYNASQEVARYRDDVSTLTEPVFADQSTYDAIQNILKAQLAKFARRISNVQFDFPPLSQVLKGNNITGTGVWSGTYADDLGSVTMTGKLSF